MVCDQPMSGVFRSDHSWRFGAKINTAVQYAEEAAPKHGDDMAAVEKIFRSIFRYLSAVLSGFDFHVRLGERIVVTEEKTVSCNVSGRITTRFGGLNPAPFADRVSVRVLGKCLWAGVVQSVNLVVLVLNNQLVYRCSSSGVGVLWTDRTVCDRRMGFFALSEFEDDTASPLINASKEGDA